MPKTPVDKYYCFVLGKNDIWMTWQILDMKTEPKAIPVKERTDDHLRFGIN